MKNKTEARNPYNPETMTFEFEAWENGFFHGQRSIDADQREAELKECVREFQSIIDYCLGVYWDDSLAKMYATAEAKLKKLGL